MAEEVNHRYLKDKNGDIYFPVTSADAIIGKVNEESLGDLQQQVADLKTSLGLMQKQINNVASDTISLTGDTGWVDYTVANAEKNGAISAGYKCMIREVSVGFSGSKNFRMRTVRINIGKVPHNEQIAQLPNGFVDETIRFVPSVSSGHTPPTVSIDTSGVMKVYFPTEDREEIGKSTQWVYGQHTWLVN